MVLSLLVKVCVPCAGNIRRSSIDGQVAGGVGESTVNLVDGGRWNGLRGGPQWTERLRTRPERQREFLGVHVLPAG